MASSAIQWPHDEARAAVMWPHEVTRSDDLSKVRLDTDTSLPNSVTGLLQMSDDKSKEFQTIC